jgi:hypothetical protein
MSPNVSEHDSTALILGNVVLWLIRPASQIERKGSGMVVGVRPGLPNGELKKLKQVRKYLKWQLSVVENTIRRAEQAAKFTKLSDKSASQRSSRQTDRASPHLC